MMGDRAARPGLADCREERRTEGELEGQDCFFVRVYVCEVKDGGALVMCREGCGVPEPNGNLLHLRQGLTP